MKEYKVYIEDSRDSEPRSHEKNTAEIIAKFFKVISYLCVDSKAKRQIYTFLKQIFAGNKKNPELLDLKFSQKINGLLT